MYEPLWLSLADALQRIVATGLDEQQAKDLLCAAMGDRAIAVRVQVDSGEPVPGATPQPAGTSVHP